MDREPPPRVVSNLLVRAAAGNLPKTIPTLINSLKPHSFVTVFCPPSAVLAHLGLKHKEKPPSISFISKERGEFDDKKVFSQALFKARKYNASLEVITRGAETAHKLEQSLRSMPFLNQATLEKLLTQACITTKDFDPAVILEQLKTLQLVHTDENGRVTYSIHSIDSPTLKEFCGLQMPAAIYLHTTLPSSLKPPSTDKPMASPVLPGVSSLSPTPILAALQCLWKLGSDLPKTEKKLINVLKPTCKVVSVCLPSTVLEELDKSAVEKQFHVYEKKVLKFSAASMFDADGDNTKKKPRTPAIQGQKRKGQSLKGKQGRFKAASSFAVHSSKQSMKRSRQEPSSLERALTHLKNGLIQHTRKLNGSILYGTDDDVIQTVAKVEEWLAQKQSIFEAASSNSDQYAPMETEEVISSTGSAAWSTAVSTKQKLVHEFFDLCVSQSNLDPEETLQRLISSGIIVVNRSGHISYNLNSRKAQLLASKDAAFYVAAERTCIRFLLTRNKVDRNLPSFAGTKRKHRNIRTRSKKIHF